MKEIPASKIVSKISEALIKANLYLPDDVLAAIDKAEKAEESPASLEVFHQLKENAVLAAKTGLPLCQDTGLAVFFVEIGEDCRVVGGNLCDSINEAVRKGYQDGYLRKSVCNPLTRKNTNDNTPAIIHIDMVSGSDLKICFMCKGGGAENMSSVAMLSPADGWDGIKKHVLNRVIEAGSNPCPPIILGIGIGGSFDLAPILAKKALLRKLDDTHHDSEISKMEKELLDEVNKLGIGAMGLGGNTTCLGVKINIAPCHIASLPLAVNFQCHSSRHGEVVF